MAKNITPKTLETWAMETSRNNHGKVRVSIAKHFGYKDLEDDFKTINKVHKAQNGLTYEQFMERNRLLNVMLERIKEEHGEAVFEKVQSCV